MLKKLFVLLTMRERNHLAMLNTAFTTSRYTGIHSSYYVQPRFALMREYSIGKRLVEGYLHQPYSWFLNRHSADLGKTILSEVWTDSDDAVQRICKRTCILR